MLEPREAPAGSSVSVTIEYVMPVMSGLASIKVSEVFMLLGPNESLMLKRREVLRESGPHLSSSGFQSLLIFRKVNTIC